MHINLDSELFNTKVKFSVAFPVAPAPMSLKSRDDGTNFTITKALKTVVNYLAAAISGTFSASKEKLLVITSPAFSSTKSALSAANVSNKALEIDADYLKGPADAEIDSEVNKKFAEEFVSKLETRDLYDLAWNAEGLRLLAFAEIEKRRSSA